MPRTHKPLAPDDVKKVLLSELEKISTTLTHNAAASDESIHSARKRLKRARAELRLLRDAVGKPRYSRENAELRNAARAVGHLRDSSVMLGTIRKLLVREKKPRCRASLRELQHPLRMTAAGVRRDVYIRESARLVNAVMRRVRRWRVPDAGFNELLKSMSWIYGKGRKALDAVRANRSDENLHELRKQTKYLEHAMSIFGRNNARVLGKFIGRAHVIAACLGDDHDLVLMQQQIQELDKDAREACEELGPTIKQLRKQLQQKALQRAAYLYKQPREVLSKVYSPRIA